MPIKKGNTTIGAIYKGTTQIAKVYKGTTLLFENAVWLDYYFSNLYHSLVPETIPKNLFDGELEVGWINSSGGLTTDTNTFRSTNYSSVKGSTTYTLSCSLTGFTNVYYYEYDENKTFTRYSGSLTFNQSISIITQSSTRYLKFAYYKNGANFANNLPTKQEANIQLYSKSYSVKNKAKVAKIYANGVVENQLIPSDKIPASGTSSDIVLTNNGDGSYTLNGTASATATFVCYSVGTLYKGHKYLMNLVPKGGSASTYLGGDANGALDPADYGGTIVSTTFNTETYVFVYYIRVFSGTSVNFTHKPQLIDLTLRYGTGNEPTTITDNRIQAILNRDYIAYNTGTYKGTDIGEFSSEPYNLFDGELEGNGINTTTGAKEVGANAFRSKNYTTIVGGQSYKIEFDATSLGSGYGIWIHKYDEYFNYLGNDFSYQNNNVSFSPDNKVKYILFHFYKGDSGWASNVPTDTNIVIHRTGTRTGYAPYQTFTPISFRYQGNGALNTHDTMEITKDNVVFTKNVASYTFTGSESWTLYSTTFFYVTLSNLPPTSDGTYPLSTNGIVTRGNSATYARIRAYIADNPQLSTSSDMNTIYPSGTKIIYPLATPQTITIPRKYMGVVDLGSLTWVMISSGRFYVENFNPPSTVRNCYCSKYLTDLSTNGISEQANNTVQMRGDLKIIDTTYTSASDFKAAMTGTYLFYETSAETTDIADTLDIEAGGTVTSNWFSWVENQLQPDNIRYINGGTGVNTAPFETTATYNFADRNPNYTSVAFGNGNGFDIIQGHKYLMAIYIKPASDTIRFSCGVTESATTYTSCSPNVWTKIASITTSSSTVASYGFVFRYNEAASVTNQVVYFKNWMTVDLTQAFGAGNEPTSINDPRIQYILNKDYIPTNTTGTLKHIDTEVLPNVDMAIKCK